MFIDVHCHLDICKNIDKITKEAEKKNILIITQGMNPEVDREAMHLSGKYKNVKAAAGIYPRDALGMTDEAIDAEIEFIRKNKDRIVCIGEIGLDLYENYILDRQRDILKKFIELAHELDKPMEIHSRAAEAESVAVLEEVKAKKVIMHCFSGSFKLVERIVKNGWYLSIPASVKYNLHFQKIAKEIDIEHLLCETDSPFLHPDKLKGNSPLNVIESYKKIAELKGMTLKECEKKIEENYRKLLG